LQQEAPPQLKEYTSRLDLENERAKPRLLAVLFADYLNHTKEDKVNLMGVYDRIYVNRELKKTPPINLFVRLSEALETPISVTVFSPANKPMSSVQFAASRRQFEESGNRPPEYPKQWQTAMTLQFPVETEGVYWFDISYKGQTLGGVGLPIEFLPEGIKEDGGTDTFV
jgi:hypothetical protein